MIEKLEGTRFVVEVDDPQGLVGRWQRYGRDRLLFKGLKGYYLGLDDGFAPEFNNPAYPWGCERTIERGRLVGYRYWHRHAGGADATVIVRLIEAP